MSSRWYVRKKSGSLETGPFETKDIIRSLKDGSVRPTTSLRREGEEEWREARAWPELSASPEAPRTPKASAPIEEAPDRARHRPRFSWMRGVLHAIWAPGLLVAVIALVVYRGAFPLTNAIAEQLGYASAQLFFLGLGISYLFQTQRTVAAWSVVGVLGLLIGAGMCVSSDLAKWRSRDAKAPSPMASNWNPSDVIGDGSGAWKFHSREHGISLQLPSSNWREASEKKNFIGSFWMRSAGVAMLAGVVSVRKQTRKEFEQTVPAFKRSFAGQSNLIESARFDEAETQNTDPYVFGHLVQAAVDRRVYVAACVVWLRRSEQSVHMIFEGQSTLLSQLGNSMAQASFEKAARSIFLSIAAEDGQK